MKNGFTVFKYSVLKFPIHIVNSLVYSIANF